MIGFAPGRKVINDRDGILGAIGSTPLVSVEGIYAKLETVNPTGSIKDRMAWHMVRKAEKRGDLRPGGKIIEVTSGNTGVAFAMISALRNYKFIAVMPDSTTAEKRLMMQEFGAEVILTPAEGGMAGAMLRYEQLVRENPDAWLPRQFESQDNIAANAGGLGKEIIKQTNGFIDIFVAGIGTGGTLLGVARALRHVNPDVQIIAVEPEESAVLSGHKAGVHPIQGIGEGFVPRLVVENMHLIDRIVTIPGRDAISMSGRLARRYGLWVGISSGANVLAALEAKRKGAAVLTVLPDTGERYLSIMPLDRAEDRVSCSLKLSHPHRLLYC